jgi:hypothetical protein
MAHLPVNHRLRPLYRAVAVLIGIYLMVFGLIGVIKCAGDPFFDRGDVTVLGLKTNLAFAVLSLIVGAIIVAGAFLGRNAGHFLNMGLGGLFMFVGVFGLVIIRSDLNKLNFSVATCVVSSLIGTALLIAGLYGKTGSDEAARHEEELRVPSKKAASV